MKLSVIFSVLLASALFAFAADAPRGPRGPVGDGFRQGPPTQVQVERLPVEVQELFKQLEVKLQEVQDIRGKIREKMMETRPERGVRGQGRIDRPERPTRPEGRPMGRGQGRPSPQN